jgi:hypothetical protein
MGNAIVRRAAASLLTVAGLAAQDGLTRAGPTFVVTLHPGKLDAEVAARLADEALAAAESTRPVLDKLYQRPAKPPAIHVYAARQEYETAAKEPAWTFVRDMVCERENAVSHVLLQPALSKRVSAAIGLPDSTRNDIVVQAAMLAACDRSELARKDSRCAEIFAAGVLNATVFTDARDGVDPLRDARFWYLAREARTKPRSLRSLCDMVYPVATRSEYDYVLQGNAAMAQLFASTGTGWAKKLLNAKVKDNELLVERRTTAVQAVLGADDKRNEERFAKLLTASAPRFRVLTPLVALRGGRILMAASTKEYARFGNAFPPPSGPYAVRATVELVDTGANTLSFVLDTTQATFVEVMCRGNQIRVATRATTDADAEWQTFPAPIEVGKPFALSIEVRDTIRVLVDSQQVADRPLAGRTMRNDWGVSILDGMAWIENPRCEPLDAPAKK